MALVDTSTPPEMTLDRWKQQQEKTKMMQNTRSEVNLVEKQLRHVTKTKMIRVTEFFKDFDPLRSGFITNQQFRRCLNEHLGLWITDENFECLVRKYGQEKKGMINYKAFEYAMENAFDPLVLDGQPGTQIQNFQSTATPLQHGITQDHQEFTDNILRKCHDYYKYRGINIKNSYSDFDRHHKGYVTESQFHRSFPGPPEVTSVEISALAQRYWDPSNGLHNYLKFHDDLVNIGAKSPRTLQGPPQPPKDKPPSPPTAESVLERIKNVVYKNGIRTTEFFCDHDKLRSGVVTENQFVNGVTLCCKHLANLSVEDIHLLVDYFRTADGRIRYNDFCHLMENAYNEPGLEKKPTVPLNRPLRGHLLRPLNSLASPEEENRVVEVLQRLRSEVRTRGLLLHPYFKDFDKGKGFTRGVTKAHFERLLHFLSLNVSKEEVKLLETKFGCGNGVDVNYTAFIQSVDEEYTGQAMEEKTNVNMSELAALPVQPLSAEEVELLVSRIREHVKCNRIRLTEYFEDADPLRAGSITATRFRQGLSSIGQPNLSEAQFQSLCALYPDPKHKGNVLWRKFVSDVDDPVLESAVSVPQPVSLPALRPGAVDFLQQTSPEDQRELEEALHRLREKVKQRRILVKPLFQDFDRHHIGYVTRSQFRQCLSSLGLLATEQELVLMEKCFCDSKGFSYLKFLGELQPPEKLKDKYKMKMTDLTQMKERLSITPPASRSVPVEEVLEKIKTKVVKERIRVQEFIKDYDKLRSGRVPLVSFSRALDLCGLELTKQELALLQQRYCSGQHPGHVDYVAFCDEVESVFTTKGLEKNPTAHVEQFTPTVHMGQCRSLSPEELQILHTAMFRIAEKVRERRIQLFPLFEDYDRVHIGSVTKTQFHRVLTELELSPSVSVLERGLILRQFEMKVGGRNDINYIAFCDMCNDIAEKQHGTLSS